METPKYLIIVTLIDGQNFTLPEGASDKIEAFVYAEARFGNESILKSDPIRLINSNPEFVTELAWQLDKKSLHQLRVERKAIKLQIFMQTRERKRPSSSKSRSDADHNTNGFEPNNSTVQLDLIGYTIVDIRSAQETKNPKFHWVPLLNPKFRKSVYNRPEIQIALTLSRLDEDGMTNDSPNDEGSSSKPINSINNNEIRSDDADCSDANSHEIYDNETNDNSKLYKTCLDFTFDDEGDHCVIERNEIIEHDIIIRCIDEIFYLYDKKESDKSLVEDCSEQYKITITIPFNSNLDILTTDHEATFYFDVHLFGTSLKTETFKELTSVETKEVIANICTTHSKLLTTYFELNPSLVIKLCQYSGEIIGLTTIQLDQLCNLDSRCRSIEGIFALQSTNDHDIQSAVHPTIGVSVVLEYFGHTSQSDVNQNTMAAEPHIELVKEHFGDDINDYLYKDNNDTHQLTADETNIANNGSIIIPTAKKNVEDALRRDSHHYCFTIDLKNFSYTTNQRLIPTLRELVVRYSYPFFGYKDTITTDASIPISSSNSIIVSGFCEFNFATTADSLLAALREIPLDFDILTCDHINLNLPERVIATSNLNLAQTMLLNEGNILQLSEKPVSTTVSTSIYSIDGEEIGELQVYLSLKDLGEPNFNVKTSVDILNESNEKTNHENPKISDPVISGDLDSVKLAEFMSDARSEFESWKEDFVLKFTEDVRKRENERFKRIYQRFEVKDAKREQEFKKKLEELNNIERRLRNSIAYIDSLEKKLSNQFELLKAKDVSHDNRIDSLDLKISKTINDIKLNFDRKLDSLPTKYRHSYEDNSVPNNYQKQTISKLPGKSTSNTTETASSQIRRSSLRSTNVTALPLPVRSSSLVRPNEGPIYKLVKRPANIVTTVITNGTGITRPRSNSTRLNLSKETHEKLINLRREKAELLKRGCRPNDELIQEINSMIEKLAY